MKTTRIPVLLASLILSSILMLSSCKKEDNTPEVNEDGLTRDVTDLVPKEILDEMEDLGLPIYGGIDPPNIEGRFVASPFILLASNRQSDIPGYQFQDYYVTFKEQNDRELTIMMDYENGSEMGNGLGSFIVGDGNRFSVFVEVISENNGETASVVNVISGELSETGINDLYFANFMLDNRGNPSGYWIEEGEGRVAFDSDGVSERL
jgi:hypothetical protein